MIRKATLDPPHPADPPEPEGPYSEKHGPEALNAIPGSREAIADLIVSWAAADANLRIMLVGSFGADLRAAGTLVDRARSDEFVDVLMPVAISLRGRLDMRQATAKFLDVRQSVKRLRDTLAHGIFALRSDLPGKILVANGNEYRKDHLSMFDNLRDDPFSFETNVRFNVWSEGDFLSARNAGVGLLNAAHAMSICLARESSEVELLRSALDQSGLLMNPPCDL